MNYIINKTVLYSPESKQLSLLLDDKSYVTLSNQAARLIVEMIKQNKNTLTREYLLKHVWEDYGATPSNNSLYMAVSELRKSFKNLGLTEQIITTKTKTGFLFEAEIDVSPSTLLPITSEIHTEEVESKAKIVTKWNLVWTFASMLVIILITTLFQTREPGSLRIKTDHMKEQFSIAKCHIYALGETGRDDQEWLNDILKSELARKTISTDCENIESSVYYQRMAPPVNETFITNCAENPTRGTTKCTILRTEND